jgi:predicted Rossmann-fold nucleotide-binding protein
MQTGKMKDFPFVLMGKSYWAPLIEFLRDGLLAAKTIDPGDLTRWVVTDSADEAVDAIRERVVRDFGLTYAEGPTPRWWLGEK